MIMLEKMLRWGELPSVQRWRSFHGVSSRWWCGALVDGKKKKVMKKRRSKKTNWRTMGFFVAETECEYLACGMIGPRISLKRRKKVCEQCFCRMSLKQSNPMKKTPKVSFDQSYHHAYITISKYPFTPLVQSICVSGSMISGFLGSGMNHSASNFAIPI
jgi:hypothetical protein